MKFTWVYDRAIGVRYSEEQLDGTPDRIIYPGDGKYWVKFRTSAIMSGPYPTIKAAKEAAEKD